MLASLREEIEAGAPETQEADLDEETLSMLAALGYVGGATAAPEGTNLADPKDKIHLFEAVGRASSLMLGEDYEEGATALEIVLGEDPEIPQAKHMLATCYRSLGRTEEAKVLLDDYLRDHPDSTPALITMAGILSEEGRFEEVAALAKRVLAVDDRNAQAYALMAGASMEANDHAGGVAAAGEGCRDPAQADPQPAQPGGGQRRPRSFRRRGADPRRDHRRTPEVPARPLPPGSPVRASRDGSKRRGRPTPPRWSCTRTR